MRKITVHLFLANIIFSTCDLKTPHFITSLTTSFILVTSAFNIDEEFPIVISNQFSGKQAHFGLSLALLQKGPAPPYRRHSTLKRETDITGWVVIGAPKANSTKANHSQIYEPGQIWRCSLGSSHGKLCEVVVMDPTGEYDPLDPQLPYRDRKDGGWLGGSMFVGESDRFVTCASRWVNQKYTDLYLLNGMCYWLPKSHLMTENTDQDWPWLGHKLSYRLSPLLNGSKQAYKLVGKWNGSQQDKNVVYDWAYGQFGFSVHVTPQNEMIAGSVGILDWTGSVVYFRNTLGPRSQFRRYNAHASSPAFSELVVVQALNNTDILESADYFGYSVTSGRFFNETISGNKTQFAGGAPRSSYMSGKVLIFTVKESELGKSEGVMELIVEPIEGNETMKGNHYGSYFGQSLLALDGNGDGFDDLFVGAPLYGASIRQKRNAMLDQEEELVQDDEKGKPKVISGDEGCVFVYWSTGEDFDRAPQALCGDKIPGARFGQALTYLKDINFDGFNDVAIGAPYENEGRGAVYIYHGGEQFMTQAQKLLPERTDRKLRTFGWSLSVGVDIDGNGYPDLAVGAYETNQVVVYRTIPVANFKASLTASIPKLLSTTKDFNLTSCISYTGHGNMPRVLAIWVKLTVEAEPEGKRLVSFTPGDINIDSDSLVAVNTHGLGAHVFSKERLLPFHSDGRSCYNFTVYRIWPEDGVTRAVRINKEYWMDVPNRKLRSKPLYYKITRYGSHPQPFVILDSSKSNFTDFLQRKRPLPSTKIFYPEKLTLPVATNCEADGDPECKADLTISAFLVDYRFRQIYGERNPFILGSVSNLTLAVELLNSRETANLPINLLISWPAGQPSVRRRPPNCDLIEGNNYSCSVQRPLKENQRETFAFVLDMSKMYGQHNDTNFDIHFNATTNSSLAKPCNRLLSTPLRTHLKPLDFRHVGSKMEYSPGNNSVSTFGIPQVFEIGLEGPSSAFALQANFQIPMTVKIDGELHRIIAMKKPMVTYDGNYSCHVENDQFIDEGQSGTVPPIISTTSKPESAEIIDDANIDSLLNDPFYELEDEPEPSTVDEVAKILRGKVGRMKRSILSKRSSLPDPRVLKISCSNLGKREITCFRVVCSFYHFTPERKAVIDLKLKMYSKVVSLLLKDENHFLIEDVESLWVETVGTVKAQSSTGNLFGAEGNLEFLSRLEIPPPYDLPAWILIVSVAGGLLLLIFLSLILRKCGFFRRSKRDELLIERAIEFRRKYGSNLPGTSGTTVAATFSTRSCPSTGRSVKRKRSFHTPVPVSLAEQSLSSCGSPTTIAKQREIPGAVDLNELRRLYAHADQDELY